MFEWFFGKKKEKEKIFCGDCQYPTFDNKRGYLCTRPELVIKTFSEDNFWRKGNGKTLTKEYCTCEKLNECNDCFWFKQKVIIVGEAKQ